MSFSDKDMFWFILLFLTSVVTDDSMDKFKLCNNEQCILIQCYFPVSEFLNAARNELKLFENFIESNHVFISYHLCDQLSANNMDEVGACIYGVLFKLYQFDANLTVHQRMDVQQAQIQEESVALVTDMISKILYRIESIDDINQLKTFIRKSNKEEEDVVVINAQSLTPKVEVSYHLSLITSCLVNAIRINKLLSSYRQMYGYFCLGLKDVQNQDKLVHLNVSRTILNYGQWFSFVYSVAKDNVKKDCLYDIYPSDSHTTLPKCGMENNIRMILEQQIGYQGGRSGGIQSLSDLTHVNVFPRTLPTLFYIYDNSTFTLILNKNFSIIPFNILNFQVTDIVRSVFLHDPYPFYLFWSVKKNVFQRLGDQPSDELIRVLHDEEQENDLQNAYGMFDDEVRYIADGYDGIEINPNVLFVKTPDDYHHLRQTYPKSAILFTVRWDSTSKLARIAFHRLASRLTNYLPMIDIDCFDWTDICNDENIFQWPTLILTQNQTTRETYQGSTDENEMALSLFRFSVDQPYQTDDDSSTEFVNSLLMQQQVVVLARIQHQEKFLYDTYKDLVDMFVDSEQFFFMFQYSTERRKDGNISSSVGSKTTVYTLNDDINHLQRLIIDALRTPLVIFNPVDFIKSTSEIFLAASRSQLDQLNHYFLSNDSPTEETPLVWIDTNSPWIVTLNQYGHIAYPAVIYIDFSNGYVYVNSTLNDIAGWIRTVRKGSATPFYTLSSTGLNEGPSQQHIDFNQQMNDEQLLNEYRFIHEESEKINEHGIGFDMNGLPIEMNV